jgi:hypothetical protein
LTAHSPGRIRCWTSVSADSEIMTSAFPFRISSKIVVLSRREQKRHDNPITGST